MDDRGIRTSTSRKSGGEPAASLDITWQASQLSREEADDVLGPSAEAHAETWRRPATSYSPDGPSRPGRGSPLGLVAGCRAGIRQRLSGHWNELPDVLRRPKGQLQHTPGAAPHLAVRLHPRKAGRRSASRARHELTNAALRVEAAVGILRREPLVAVIVTRQDHVDARLVHDTPCLTHPGIAAVGARPEQRLVEVGERTARRPASELRAQPGELRRSRRRGRRDLHRC